MNSRIHARDVAAAIREEVKGRRVTDEEAEPVVVHRASLDPLQVFQRSHFARQEFAHQRSARRRAGFLVGGIAVVCQRSESPIQSDAEPGASRLEVAAGENVWMIVPESGGRGGPTEVF